MHLHKNNPTLKYFKQIFHPKIKYKTRRKQEKKKIKNCEWL